MIRTTAPVPGLLPGSSQRLNGRDINPETGIVSLVRLVRVDLGLDPLNGFLVECNILRVRVRQPSVAIAVAREPRVVAVVLLALGPGRDVGGRVLARYRGELPSQATISAYFGVVIHT